jgi:hypothetical protein
VKLTGVLGQTASDLGLRFNLLGILPVGVLVLFLIAMQQSGAFTGPPDVAAVVRTAASIDAADSVWAAVGVLALAVILQPLQISLVRLLEGYWGDSRLGRALSAVGVAYHQRKREQLQQATQGTTDVAPDARAAMATAAWQLQHLYPTRDRVLPTTLGNVLRAAEDRGGRSYGMDAVVLWPRLYPLLPKPVTDLLADQRDQLDIAARFCVVFLVAGVIAGVTLIAQGWWWLVPVACLLLAWLAYRSAVAAAIAYGDGIQIAFDLHRFDLLAALHLELPVDRDMERTANRELCDFLRQGVPVNLQYVHKPPRADKAEQP